MSKYPTSLFGERQFKCMCTFKHQSISKYLNVIFDVCISTAASVGEHGVYSCGQSYKASTLVNYDSRVVSKSNLLVITTLES